jgi:hypothetical protein
MHWEAIRAIAELLGALGVIATLVYLARQINQNTSTVRASAAASLSEAQTGLSALLAQDADINRSLRRSTITAVLGRGTKTQLDFPIFFSFRIRRSAAANSASEAERAPSVRRQKATKPRLERAVGRQLQRLVGRRT